MRLGRPSYRGARDRPHDSEARIGVLLANLGSPASPDAAGLRPYLRQFLSDTRVIEAPRWLWLSILNLVVVPFRSPRSAKAYREIWTDEGAPLLAMVAKQREALANRLGDRPIVVEQGMTYGEPSLPSALRRLQDAGATHLLVLPLYPQYAASSVGSVFDAVARELSTWRWVPHLRFVSGYCQDPRYVEILARSITEHREKHGDGTHTLFSFHGTQLESLVAGDPYHCQCPRTAREAAAAAGLADGTWTVSFQSRFGRDPWLQPYTIEMMERLPKEGTKDLHVVCPAFSADCLETLEEICGECKEAFLAAGGESFSYVPALNDREDHIEFLAEIVNENVVDWEKEVAKANDPNAIEERSRRFTETKPSTEGGS